MLVPCNAQEVVVPPWAAPSLKKADSLEAKVRTQLAERRQRMRYERESFATVGECQQGVVLVRQDVGDD